MAEDSEGMHLTRLGAVVITRNAKDTLHPEDVLLCLSRHTQGDWGDVCTSDWKLNDEAAKYEDRVLSSYQDRQGTKFWIITEWDRSYTTVLLPEDY